MHYIRIAIFAVLMLCNIMLFGTPSTAPVNEKTLQNLFFAISKVETNHNDDKVSSDWKKIGRYQISEEYWLDADMTDGAYRDCKDKEYAERVMLSYWQKHQMIAVINFHFEVLARIHIGGKNGHREKWTEKYWEKVKQELYK